MITLTRLLGRFLKWVGILVGGLVALALALFVIGYVINMRDEALSPRHSSACCD